jgi:hypothetical protein
LIDTKSRLDNVNSEVVNTNIKIDRMKTEIMNTKPDIKEKLDGRL